MHEDSTYPEAKEFPCDREIKNLPQGEIILRFPMLLQFVTGKAQ